MVIGDVYWDSVAIHQKPGLLRCDRPAGAWLLQRLLCCSSNNQFKVIGYPYPNGYATTQMKDLGICEEPKLDVLDWYRAASRASLYPKGSGEKPEDTKVYRLEESFGFVADLNGSNDKIYQDLNGKLLVKPELSTGNPTRVVVINDNPRLDYGPDGDKVSESGFRFAPKIKETIEIIAKNAKFLVVSIKREIAESEVLKAISGDPGLKSKTIAIVSGAQLRSEGHNVPSTLALETRARDLWNERAQRPLKDLMGCRYVLVHDQGDVFYFQNTPETIPSKFGLYFYPYFGQQVNNPGRYGEMAGYVKILIAAIVKKTFFVNEQDLLSPKGEGPTGEGIGPIGEGICAGLKLWEKHFEGGFQLFDAKLKDVPAEKKLKEIKGKFRDKTWHPFDRLFDEGKGKNKEEGKEQNEIQNNGDNNKKAKIAWVEFPLPAYYKQYCPSQADEKFNNWSRVDWFVGQKKNFDKLLHDVVRKGVKVINSDDKYLFVGGNKEKRILCPVAKIGSETIDPEEINGLIAIYKLIVKYLQDKDEKPLSIAVFGPPGTGKSTAVENILKAARSATRKSSAGGEALTCNLSQLTDPKSLTSAFHQAQDRALAEEVPLVFFDEFDTSLPGQPYGWLKYFLAPMQDGKFKAADTNESYRVGKAIFAFAGGTAATFEKFQEKVGENNEVKGPDFISRLRGFLNVRSINVENSEQPVSSLLALRRALILNSLLNKMVKEIVDPSGEHCRVKEELINAFLHIREYRHGIRSMVAILKMSQPEKGWLQTSSLPSRAQLRMHVDDREFLDLVAKPELAAK